MMISIDVIYLYLLLGANAIVLGIACFSFSRFERRCKQIEKFWESPTGSAVAAAGDVDADEQTPTTQRLEKRLGELHRSVAVMQLDKPQRPEERNLPIENALRMAKLGASIQDLTKSCGLNIGEARLMQKLHGKAAIATAEN